MVTDRNGRGRFGALFLWAIIAGVAALVGCLSLTAAQAPECRPSTEAVDAMPTQTLVFGSEQEHTIDARLAATESHRAAGMQHLCPDVIAGTPILFLFDEPVTPAFHMNNVHAALDIVFVDSDHRVIDVSRMEPGQRSLTRPPGPVIAALEMKAGAAAAYGIEPGVRVEW
ncbi:DUF192 domain-containing protein [Aquisalimonas asiatica]|uniref:Uncharacterized ACR, COG1430 n=1 Tax=Aquisalimonas asiatica TaxID=406100 RepID=A0A1H8QDG6_9GAMM|nr:DUF192 domain-containing protein [Aquisalimonas asiatica]SEO52280.1 Uncharacterized ACR, COG1430 [Aquisalimonas asiatica]